MLNTLRNKHSKTASSYISSLSLVGTMMILFSLSTSTATRMVTHAFATTTKTPSSIALSRITATTWLQQTSKPKNTRLFSTVSNNQVKIKMLQTVEISTSSTPTPPSGGHGIVNLHTIPLNELEIILTSWGYPKYRAKQVYQWIHSQGVTDVTKMNNIPKALQEQLLEYSTPGQLTLEVEQVSKRDGTVKRAYKLHDGSLIESVLMGPYDDGRYTACISSQAGCAQGCVFCATGQMGFTRQLTAEEIFEQVSRFSSELTYQDKQDQKRDEQKNDNTSSNSKKKNGGGSYKNSPQQEQQQQQQQQHGKSKRLSNIVFMGMGEPLGNYKNVVKAIRRIQSELGIGYRRITVSTVGIVPNIYKLANDLPQVRLAVSLHCATDKERSELLPANARNGGLDALMESLQYYIKTVGRRVTLEWALIEGENDTPETAHALGKLIQKWLPSKGKVNSMVHVNVIPLNPTGGYSDGKPSSRQRVRAFCDILQDRYYVSCTPRVRRGIDIDAGCGQLTTKVMEEDKQRETILSKDGDNGHDNSRMKSMQWTIADDAVLWKEDETDIDDFDDGDNEDNGNGWDYEYKTTDELEEVARLIKLVEGTTVSNQETNIADNTYTEPQK